MGAVLSSPDSKHALQLPFQLPKTDAEIARATHNSPPTSLPQPTATAAEVRQFLYEILTLELAHPTCLPSRKTQTAKQSLQAILTNDFRPQGAATTTLTASATSALSPALIRAMITQWTLPSTHLRLLASQTLDAPPRPGPKLNGKGFLNLDYEIGRFHLLCSEKDRWSAQMLLRRHVGRLLRTEEAEREEERERERVEKERVEQEVRDVWVDGWRVVRRWEENFLPKPEGKRMGSDGGNERSEGSEGSEGEWHDSAIGSEVEDEAEKKDDGEEIMKDVVGKGDVKMAISMSIQVDDMDDAWMGYGNPGRRTWGL